MRWLAVKQKANRSARRKQMRTHARTPTNACKRHAHRRFHLQRLKSAVCSVSDQHNQTCAHKHTHVTTPGCVNAKCCCGLEHATCCFCISLSPFLSLSISFSLLCTHTLTMSDDMTQSLMKRYVGAPSAERAHLTHTHSCTNEISSYSDREDRITRG